MKSRADTAVSYSMKNAILTSVLALLHAALLSSCASGSHQSLAVSTSDYETIVILGTNDIHGALAPLRMKSREADGVTPVEYETGGALMLASHVRELKEEFGNKLIWLDGGDEFQGSIESNSAKGAPMVSFFNSTGLQGAAIGNHEFDFGAVNDPADRLGTLKARASEAHYPYLAANIFDAKSGQVVPFPNSFPSVMMNVGRLKVGVIGLSTLETPHTTFPENIKSLIFKELESSALREAQALRKAGAQIVLLTAHVGLKCDTGRASPANSVRKPTDPLGFCSPDDELVKFLKKVPPGTIDAVVSGHSHQVVHHWVEGVPVVQAGSSAKYLNLIYLTYDLKNGRVATDRTLIEGPVPICSQVFKNQGDCNGERPAPSAGRGPLVPPVFHGETLEPDATIVALLKPVFERSALVASELVTQAARRLEHDRRRESELGNLITDAMRLFAGTDAALMNSGGIRAPIEQGPVRFENVFRTLPFDNTITVVPLTGAQLKLMLRVVESGGRGFHAISGLRLRLIPLEREAPSDDLNRNGKIEPWEVNRLLGVTLEDGTPLRDEALYTIAIPDFLALGGDDLKWIMTQIPRSKLKMNDRLLRDVVLEHLKTRLPSDAGWNSTEHPLVDPKKPRYVFSKPGAAKSKKKARKKRS